MGIFYCEANKVFLAGFCQVGLNFSWTRFANAVTDNQCKSQSDGTHAGCGLMKMNLDEFEFMISVIKGLSSGLKYAPSCYSWVALSSPF